MFLGGGQGVPKRATVSQRLSFQISLGTRKILGIQQHRSRWQSLHMAQLRKRNSFSPPVPRNLNGNMFIETSSNLFEKISRFQGTCSAWIISPMVWIPAMGALRNPSLLPPCIRIHSWELRQPRTQHMSTFGSNMFHLMQFYPSLSDGLELPYGLDSGHRGTEESLLLPGCVKTSSLASNSMHPSLTTSHMFNLLQVSISFQRTGAPLWSGFWPWGHWGIFHCCQVASGPMGS